MPVTVHKSSRLCENSDAALTKPVFTEVSPVLSDQTPANRENSLCASLFSSETRVFTQSARYLKRPEHTV